MEIFGQGLSDTEKFIKLGFSENQIKYVNAYEVEYLSFLFQFVQDRYLRVVQENRKLVDMLDLVKHGFSNTQYISREKYDKDGFYYTGESSPILLHYYYNEFYKTEKIFNFLSYLRSNESSIRLFIL